VLVWFLWVGEVVASGVSKYGCCTTLCLGDVRVKTHANSQYLEVHIKASKADPFRLGVSVFLEVTASPLCPVSAILNYMVIHGSRPGPFFVFSDGTYLTRKRFVEAVLNGRFRLIGICRAQLPNWCSNHCGQARYPGLLNQDLGLMAECGLLPVHPDSKDHTVLNGKNPVQSAAKCRHRCWNQAVSCILNLGERCPNPCSTP